MIVLEVNGERIPAERIRAQAAALRAQLNRPVEPTAEAFEILRQAEDLVTTHVLADQEAARLNLSRDALLESWLRGVSPPAKEELRNYYRQHRQQFWSPETIHVSQIIKNVQDEESRCGILRFMDDVASKLAAGADFTQLARECSDCPANGGDLGYFARGTMVEEFDSVVFNAPLRQPTAVFATQFGYHIALVHDLRPEGIRPFGEIAAMLAERMTTQRNDQLVGKKLAELREKAVIRRIKVDS